MDYVGRCLPICGPAPASTNINGPPGIAEQLNAPEDAISLQKVSQAQSNADDTNALPNSAQTKTDISQAQSNASPSTSMDVSQDDAELSGLSSPTATAYDDDLPVLADDSMNQGTLVDCHRFPV
jgi:hypothetical protein